jgi:hypothetical protein
MSILPEDQPSGDSPDREPPFSPPASERELRALRVANALPESVAWKVIGGILTGYRGYQVEILTWDLLAGTPPQLAEHLAEVAHGAPHHTTAGPIFRYRAWHPDVPAFIEQIWWGDGEMVKTIRNPERVTADQLTELQRVLNNLPPPLGPGRRAYTGATWSDCEAFRRDLRAAIKQLRDDGKSVTSMGVALMLPGAAHVEPDSAERKMQRWCKRCGYRDFHHMVTELGN